MTLRSCDVCGKILTKEDDYFTLDEVTFHKGDASKDTVRVTMQLNDVSKAYDLDESWCDYSDKHFCVECWKKESIARFYK